MREINFTEIENWIEAYKKYKQPKRKKQILNLIFMTCLPFVRTISYGLARRSTDPIEDIIQVGNIGLFKAIKRYNKEYNNLKLFLSYAIIWEIKHYLRDKASIMKPSREIIELSYRINKLSAEELEKAGEQYTQEAIANNLNTTQEKVREAMEIDRRKMISLNQINFNEEKAHSTYEDILSKEEEEDKEEKGDKEYNKYKDVLKEAVYLLPPKLSIIIESIYFNGLSQKDTAIMLKTSQSNISRLQKKAVKMLYKIITDIKDNDK